MDLLGGYSIKGYFQLYRKRKDPNRQAYWRVVNGRILRRLQTWFTVILIAGAGGGMVALLSENVADFSDEVVAQVQSDLDRLELADRALRDLPPDDQKK